MRMYPKQVYELNMFLSINYEFGNHQSDVVGCKQASHHATLGAPDYDLSIARKTHATHVLNEINRDLHPSDENDQNVLKILISTVHDI